MEEEKKEMQLPELEKSIHNEVVIGVKGEKHVYTFKIPFGAPLDEAYYAACNAANEVARLFKEAAERQKAQQEEAAEKEENKE